MKSHTNFDWKPSPQSTAYHEAGHLVLHLLVGHVITKVTITHDGDIAGSVDADWSPQQKAEGKFPNSVRVQTLYAGLLGESFIGQVFVIGARNDVRRARDWGCQEVLGDNWHLHPEFQEIQRDRIFIPSRLDHFLRPNYETAWRLIQQHESLVHVFARNLLSEKTLSGEEIDAIYEAHRLQQNSPDLPGKSTF